jgi:L-histidine Nalpha-methyltransferase
MTMSPRSFECRPDARIHCLVRSTEDPLAHDGPNVIYNLTKSPKRISSVYVYDKYGTELFERQCATPEYYLRRVETQLLRRHAGEIVERCGTIPIVELGAGTAEKTRILLTEYQERGVQCDYYPIDIDTETLGAAAFRLASELPGLTVHCLGTTYEAGLRALAVLPGKKLFMFLGSSLGNMELQEIDALLGEIFRCSSPGDYLLLGADLDKDPAVINRAYNDSAGYGARSTLNILRHLNRRYDGNFVLDNFRYRSTYDPPATRNEVRIESLMDQTVTLEALRFSVSFGAGELIDAEVMWKFRPEVLGAILDRAGLPLIHSWVDPVCRYGLFLSRRRR